MTILLLVIVILAIPLIPAGVFLGWYFRGQDARIERLEEQERKRKLPGKVMDGLEDAMAIANDCGFQNNATDEIISTLVMMLDRNEATRAYINTRLGHLAVKLQNIRTEPNGYDSDAPNQKRTI